MKQTSRIALSFAFIMLGIGIFFPISNVYADTQAKQHIKFSLTIDKSLQDKIQNTVTVTDEKVQRVRENGILIIDALLENVRYVYISENQMAHLIARNAIIQINKGDVVITIPTANFTETPRELTLIMERVIDGLPAIDKAIGSVYDFTLKWGDEIVSVFEHAITLSFSVHGHDNPNELQVYFWNEELEKWEVIGGDYRDGYIHANTHHFSTFAVFQPKKVDSPHVSGGNDNVMSKPKNKDAGVSLPKTATHQFNFLAIGIVLFVFGSFLTIFRRRRLHVE